MSRLLSVLPALWTGLFLSACVTINVYFPAAAAEAAADRIVREIYGEEVSAPAPTAEPVPAPQSWLDWLIPSAQAAGASLDINTPVAKRLTASMASRHQALAPHYSSGALGMTADGEVTLRDLKAVGLRERAAVQKLVAEENRDRAALYAEIARANGHPEWEAEIRSTFARRFVANAPAGWWYQKPGGAWARK